MDVKYYRRKYVSMLVVVSFFKYPKSLYIKELGKCILGVSKKISQNDLTFTYFFGKL